MAVGAFAAYNLQLRVPGLPLLVSFALVGNRGAGVSALRVAEPQDQGFLPVGCDAGCAVCRGMGADPVQLVYQRQRVRGHHLATAADRWAGLQFAPRPLPVDPGRGGGVVLAGQESGAQRVRPQLDGGARHGHRRRSDRYPSVQGQAAGVCISGFYLGVAGSLWAFTYLGTVEPHGFDLSRSFQVLFIIIIGGLGSVLGNFLGAAFIVLFPILLANLCGLLPAGLIDSGQLENIQKMLFGALIIAFLIKEPEGLARLWQRLRQRARVWPLRY